MGSVRDLTFNICAVFAPIVVDILIDDDNHIIWDHGILSPYPDTHHIVFETSHIGRDLLPDLVRRYYYCGHCGW